MSFRVVLTDPDLHPPSEELETVLAKCDARLDLKCAVPKLNCAGSVPAPMRCCARER